MKQIAGRYNIISKLGQGGMGTVWRVYDRLDQHEVALKQVLLPENQLVFASKAGTDDTDKLRLSLAQEFSLLATLRHPHILSVMDFGFDDEGHPFYTMTLLENGLDVKSYATNISTGQRIRLLGQMLQALHYLHRRGILHRDLKPDNVFVTKDKQIKVMDFGLAKGDQAQSTSNGENITGTINYMAPELFQGKSASVASDLHAIGVIIYEIMVGEHPFPADNIGQRIMKIMTAAPDFSAIPDNFVPWMENILEKDPAKRFPTAYDAMIEFYDAVGIEMPAEDHAIRESFLQASEFIGRDDELKQLINGLEQTTDGANAFFLIGGESGVGKSRLLDELRVRALVKGANVMRGQGVEGGGLPFQLWRNIVRRMLLVVEVTDLQAGILKDIVPDIGTLLGKEITNAPELTGNAYQDRMILTIVDLFRKLTRPVVLLLEDLQWTVESLAVLEQMLKVPEQLPKLMLVATYRDDEAPELPEKLVGMTHIKLGRLNADAVSQLSRAMLGERGIRDEIVQTIQRHSEGNTFFIVETVRALAEESGSLAKVTTAEIPQVVFTGSMQELMQRRLSRVDAQYKEIQALAAVIGREIDMKLLAHAFDEASVNAWLRNAADYGVVSIQDNVWRFAHDKLRETLIADIPEETLPQIHRTAAESIESVYPDDDGYNEALLSHWQHVGDLDKSYAYLLPVAENMITIRGTYAIAESHLQWMLDCLPRDDGRRIAFWNWLAESAETQGNYRASQGYALQAQELATSLDDRKGLATSLHNLGQIAQARGEYARATDLIQQSLAIHQQLGDQQGIASCLNNLGNIVESQGEYVRATDLIQQSLAIRQQLGAQRGIAICLNNLGGIALAQGESARATDLYQQSLAISQQLGDQRGIAICLNNLGGIALAQGESARATGLIQQSLAISQQLGDQLSIAMCLGNLGHIAHHQGESARATGLIQQSLAISQQLGDQLGIAMCLGNLGHIAHHQGESARAAELFQQSMVLFQQLGDQYGIAECLNNLGTIAAVQGESARATSLLQQSLVIANDMQVITLILLNIVGFARYFFVQGQIERAAHFIGMVRDHPAQDSEVRVQIEDVIPKLEAAFPAEELQAALEHGKSLDLDTVVQELLDEFAPSEDDKAT